MVEYVTRFTREAFTRMEQRDEPTVTSEQLGARHEICNSCDEFGGVICNRIGCSTKAWCINTYFDMVLDPRQKCRFKETGFPAITENP